MPAASSDLRSALELDTRRPPSNHTSSSRSKPVFTSHDDDVSLPKDYLKKSSSKSICELERIRPRPGFDEDHEPYRLRKNVALDEPGYVSGYSEDDYPSRLSRIDYDRKKSVKDHLNKEYPGKDWRKEEQSGKEMYSSYDEDIREFDSRDNRKQLRDIDARTEKVPCTHFAAREVKEKDGYVSVEDSDGKTTFYHYTEPGARSLSHDRKSSPRRTSVDSLGLIDRKRKLSEHDFYLEKQESFERPVSSKKKMKPTEGAPVEPPKEKASKRKKKEKEKEKEKKKKPSVLEQVSEILKSCSGLQLTTPKPIKVSDPKPGKKEAKEHVKEAAVWKPDIKHEIKLNKELYDDNDDDDENDDDVKIEKSLEDGEIHGTDAEDTVNEIDDGVFEEPDKNENKRKVFSVNYKF